MKRGVAPNGLLSPGNSQALASATIRTQDFFEHCTEDDDRMKAADRARTEWLERIVDFESAGAWKSWQQPSSRRTLLRDLHLLLHATPPNLLQGFDGFDEADLQRRARDLMCHLGAREVCTAQTSVEEALSRCATVLRALDELLMEGGEHIADEAPDCWLTSDGSHYVIPTPRAVMREGGPRTRQTFGRRGLLHHRIIPTRIGDVDIVVDLHPDVTEAAGDGTRRVIGCAIFASFALTYDRVGENGFIVTSVDCEGGIEAAVDQHCSQARDDGCDVLVWPELTLTPERVDQLRRTLAAGPLRTSLPPIVVAGSWHVGTEGSFHNMAPVLDGRGDDLEPFGKSRRFAFDGLSEAIEPYGRIHILATDRELVAFAICKDFCDKAKTVPVAELDVDLVLVPSMGLPNTMTAHRDAADGVKIDFGARTVVAQQTYPRRGADAEGYILKGLADPREAELKALAGRSGLTTFQCEEKTGRSSASAT